MTSWPRCVYNGGDDDDDDDDDGGCQLAAAVVWVFLVTNGPPQHRDGLGTRAE